MCSSIFFDVQKANFQGTVSFRCDSILEDRAPVLNITLVTSALPLVTSVTAAP